MSKLKVIFMGTPEFAVPGLAALADKTEVVCAVTQPDRPKGRGHKLQPPPVKVFAESLKIPVIQPEKVKVPEVVEKLAAFKPDLITVIAFGQILSQEILDIPKFGCINVHASLLPKYRGAAPIERCLIDGEKITGITTMQMNAGLDTGDMLLKSEVQISENMILPELREKLMTAGADLLLKTIYLLEHGELNPIKQDDSKSTYAPMLDKETGHINWTDPAEKIHNLVRGLYGGAYTFAAGEKFKIWRTKILEKNSSAVPGEISVRDKKLTVGTGDGLLEILEIQAPGSKKLAAGDFLRGHSIEKSFE